MIKKREIEIETNVKINWTSNKISWWICYEKCKEKKKNITGNFDEKFINEQNIHHKN